MCGGAAGLRSKSQQGASMQCVVVIVGNWDESCARGKGNTWLAVESAQGAGPELTCALFIKLLLKENSDHVGLLDSLQA